VEHCQQCSRNRQEQRRVQAGMLRRYAIIRHSVDYVSPRRMVVNRNEH
jgi:hypothetical protein